MKLTINPININNLQYKAPINKSFGAQNPVLSTNNSNDIFSRDDHRAIQELIRELTNRKDSRTFIEGNMPISEFYRQISNLYKLIKYIETNSILSKLCDARTDIVDFYIDSKKHKIDFNLNLEDRKPALEQLTVLAKDKETQKLFDLIGHEAFYDIVALNLNPFDSIRTGAVENAKILFSSASLKPLWANLKNESIYQLVKNNFDDKLVSKNLKILKDILSKPEFSFIKSPNVSIDINVLKYTGNIKKLFKIFSIEAAKLQKQEKIKLNVSPENGMSQIKIYVERGSELVSSYLLNYDKSMKEISNSFSSFSIKSNGEKQVDVSVRDFRNNTDYEIKRVKDAKHKSWPIIYQVRNEKDSSGNVINSEIFKPSAVSGVFDIVNTNKNGVKTIKSSVYTDQKSIVVKKNLVSPSGVKTYFDYSKDLKTQNEKFLYRITDKNGNILSEKSKIIRYLNKNLSVQNIDGKIYNVKYSPDSIVVFDTKEGKNYKIDFDLYMEGKNHQSIKTMLKSLPANELIAVSEKVSILKKTNDIKSSQLFLNNMISSSQDAFIFIHELGHAKDEVKENISDLISNHKFDMENIVHSISSDKKLLKIFNKEKDAFFKVYPKYITSLTSYFTGDSVKKSQQKMLRELVAEVNAIINVPFFAPGISERSHYLQENFPETIAYLMNKKL